MLVWTHIANILYKPWRVTVVLLELIAPDSVPDEKACERSSHVRTAKLLLTAGDRINCKTLFMHFTSMNLDLEWSVQAWKLSGKEIASADLGTLVAHRLDEPGSTLWKGDAVEKTCRPRRPAHETLNEEEQQGHVERARKRRRAESQAYDTAEYVPVNEQAVDSEDNMADDDADDDSDVLIELDYRDKGGAVSESEEHPLASAYAAFDEELVWERDPPAEAAVRSDGPAAASDSPPLQQLSAAILERPGNWGPFTFSLKQAKATRGGSRFGGYEISCPFHRKSEKTSCKKFVSLRGSSAECKQRALMLARHWAIQAPHFQTQHSHVHEANMRWEDCPSVAQLERMKIHDRPSSRPRTDAEILAGQSDSRPSNEGASSHARGAKAKARAKPKHVPAAQGEQARGSEAVEQSGQTSGRSSTSSSTSSSSSSSSSSDS